MPRVPLVPLSNWRVPSTRASCKSLKPHGLFLSNSRVPNQIRTRSCYRFCLLRPLHSAPPPPSNPPFPPFLCTQHQNRLR
ncbi:hypothetical protein AAC387_Pa01g0049 [Persea americana]